ncbi:UNVERIFIED_CONTAM: hypothetical protein HDU68_012143 [Siphonaria sp. JEL0065]|nr:hypothetical protein HDU68_012143 [Siphonaria sp. JEL0065]
MFVDPVRARLSLSADIDQDVFAASVAFDLMLKPQLNQKITNITLHAVGLSFDHRNVSLYGYAQATPSKSRHSAASSNHLTNYLSHDIASTHSLLSHNVPKDDPPLPALHPTQVIFNPHSETVTLVFPIPLRHQDPSTPLTLHITFTGPIGYKSMRGFFKSPIPSSVLPPNKPKFIAATHFEPLSARRAFPCFDEPHFRLFWTLVVAVPKLKKKDLLPIIVVSNRDVESVTEDPRVKGWNVWRFQEGEERMPSYLVAWGIGQVEAVEETALVGTTKKGIKVRGFVYEGVEKDNVRYVYIYWMLPDN